MNVVAELVNRSSDRLTEPARVTTPEAVAPLSRYSCAAGNDPAEEPIPPEP